MSEREPPIVIYGALASNAAIAASKFVAAAITGSSAPYLPVEILSSYAVSKNVHEARFVCRCHGGRLHVVEADGHPPTVEELVGFRAEPLVAGRSGKHRSPLLRPD